MKKIFYLICLILLINQDCICHTQKENIVRMQPIELSQRELAKALILQVVHSTWEIQEPFEEFAHYFYESKEFIDIDNCNEVYSNNNGIFLVIMDHNSLIGTGAIKRKNDMVCELKRMFIHKKYQGYGLGSRLMRALINFAKIKNYKKITLEVWRPKKQKAALHLYKKFGFREISGNQTAGEKKVFMEKTL